MSQSEIKRMDIMKDKIDEELEKAADNLWNRIADGEIKPHAKTIFSMGAKFQAERMSETHVPKDEPIESGPKISSLLHRISELKDIIAKMSKTHVPLGEGLGKVLVNKLGIEGTAKYILELEKSRNEWQDLALKPRADVQKLISALKYCKNEMKYRIFQIEGCHEIPMVGEMHTAVELADEALKEFEK